MIEVHYREPSLKVRILNGLVYFALGIISVGIGFLLYWAFTGKDALTIRNAPIPVKPVVAKSEEVLTLTVDFCKHTNATGRVVRRLVSEQTEVFSPTMDDPTDAGCYSDVKVPVPIPPQTPPGRYHVNYRVVYKTNPLHTVTEEFISEQFEVTE